MTNGTQKSSDEDEVPEEGDLPRKIRGDNRESATKAELMAESENIRLAI